MATAASILPLAWIPGAITWIVIWSALATGTVAITMLLRTRLSGAKPWQKCAILSLWVHVLLACLATYVRIGVGGGPGIGPGEGGPMRVAIGDVDAALLAALAVPVDVQASHSEAEPVAVAVSRNEPAEIAVPDSEPPVAETSEPATEPTPAEEPAPAEPEPVVEQLATDSPPAPPTPDLALEAPTLLAQPEPDPAPAPPPAEEATEAVVAAAVEPAKEPPSPADAVAAVTPAPEIESPPASPSTSNVANAPSTSAVARSSVPQAYAARFADRDSMIAGGGGNPTTERAVRSALAWLAAAQEADGHWDPKRHGAGQERYAVLGQNRGTTGARADTGITALALLAFLGAGHTHEQGPYADNIARGLDYLRRTQGANGNLGGGAEFFAHMYCHSMATFAVGEAAAMTGDEKLLPIVRKAVAYTLAAQHPTDGGWRYQPGDSGDTSQLGWQLMALKSATLAGVELPPATLSRVDNFLRNVERGAHGGLAAYRPEGPPSRAMTAEALFCRQLLTRRADGALSAAAIDEARRALLEEPPGGVLVNYYYWYYATIALHRMQHHSPASDEAWDEWNGALTRTLVGSQTGDGSWPSTCVWGGYGGRVYTTALATMCLEVYYRYTPENDEEALARRHEWQSLPAK